jgi:hypothetical protein
MSAKEAKRPDVARIVECSRSLFRERVVSRETAIEALHQIRDNLRCEFNASDDDLDEIIKLLRQLESS